MSLEVEEEADSLDSEDILISNIHVAKTIGRIVGSSYGPKGMKKLMVDSLGYIVVSGEGAKMMDCMNLWHPIANIMIDTASTQKRTIGDGSISVIILLSELLRRAEILVDLGVHPLTIANGYEKASKKAQLLLDDLAVPMSLTDGNGLRKLAYTALRSKIDEPESNILSSMIVEAVQSIESKNASLDLEIDNLHVIKKPEGNMADSLLVKGIVIDEAIAHPDMPRRIDNAKIAVLTCPLEIEKLEHLPPSLQASILIEDPSQIKSFTDEEYRAARNWVETIASSGANVVLSKKRMSDLVQFLLAKRGIMGISLWRFASKDKYLYKVSKACDANIISDLLDLEGKDLGFAELVEERKVANSDFVFIQGCRDPKSVTLMIRGVSKELTEETERAVLSTFRTLSNLSISSSIIAGGGSAPLELALRLKDYSLESSDREQLAIDEFGESLKVIPVTLVKSAGHNPLDLMPQLIARHQEPINTWYGFDVTKGEIADMMSEQVLEPVLVMKQAIKAASEIAIMVLRVDNILKRRNDESSIIPKDAPGQELPGFLSAEHKPEFKDWKRNYTVF